MGRITAQQTAALDVLDWLYFNHVLVLCVAGDDDLTWFKQFIDQVDERVRQAGLAGSQAECMKHYVLCFMEILLADPIEKLVENNFIAPIPMPPGLDADKFREHNEFKQRYFLAMVLAVGETAHHESLGAALDIATELLDDFRDAPATVRHRLAERCLAFQFLHAPFDFFTWVAELEVIHCNKFQAKRTSFVPDNVIVRIVLLCEFESIRRSVTSEQSDIASVRALLEGLASSLSVKARKLLLRDKHHYETQFYTQPSSRRMHIFDLDKLRDPDYVRQFLEGFNNVFHRNRLWQGSQASWLGMLGAALVALHKAHVSPELPIYMYVSPYEDKGKDRKEQDCTADRIALFLRQRGFTIHARTLYDRHCHFTGDLSARVLCYYNALRLAGAAPPADSPDMFYNSSITVTAE
jgi:hypothetical protein